MNDHIAGSERGSLAQRIPAETKQRVLEAAKKLGYRPNCVARLLSGRRSRMIGVIAPDSEMAMTQ